MLYLATNVVHQSMKENEKYNKAYNRYNNVTDAVNSIDLEKTQTSTKMKWLLDSVGKYPNENVLVFSSWYDHLTFTFVQGDVQINLL